ncbi:hypothetical protein CDO26_05800 [Sinorhizobium meliloti]|uniref:hypothetical protein n=1 Tax=Sinorhizobium TaxID=28105 RepID=UPI000B4A0884|nr:MULTISPECIES: hypothetical protein [Sinorhizobium]ASP84164.1 hypothetical protein CDO26_05800 [Sinorhizobium meliloti]MBO1963818.1 hypothetical protein [Sinorhizobium medicae]MQW29591.1 hypothetical protein [Sinorhizobium meliloti]
MPYLPIITVAREGDYYSLGRKAGAPIRIYPDRWIEDDVAATFTGRVRRERLSRREFRQVVRAAKRNRKEGRA